VRCSRDRKYLNVFSVPVGWGPCTARFSISMAREDVIFANLSSIRHARPRSLDTKRLRDLDVVMVLIVSALSLSARIAIDSRARFFMALLYGLSALYTCCLCST
jgi:hypothetical protein